MTFFFFRKLKDEDTLVYVYLVGKGRKRKTFFPYLFTFFIFALTHDFERDWVALSAAFGVDGPADIVAQGTTAHVLEDQTLRAHNHPGGGVLVKWLALKIRREKKSMN